MNKTIVKINRVMLALNGPNNPINNKKTRYVKGSYNLNLFRLSASRKFR